MPEKNVAAFYSKAELARYFDVPESTMRFYCTRFADFLPSTGEGRKRRYAFACLEVLSYIRKQLPRLRSSEALECALAGRFPRTLPSVSVQISSGNTPDPERGNIPTGFPANTADKEYDWGANSIHGRFAQLLPPDNLPSEWMESAPVTRPDLHLRARSIQNALMDRIDEAMELLAAENREKNSQLAARADATDREITALREEVRTMRLLLSTAEKTQQADIEQLRALLLKVAKTLTEKNA